MFQSRDIAEIRLAGSHAAMESADTTITVNGGGSNPPPRPEFRTPPRPIETTEHVPTQSTTHHTVVTPPTSSSSTHRQINWGGVLKGAAIVTGVVLAAVVAYAVVVPAVGGALSWLGANTFLGGAINGIAPAVAWAGDMAMSGALFVGHFVESFAVTLFGGTGIASTVAGATAAGTAVAPATATAISGATGALAAGGAVAVAAPLAAKAIMSTAMVDTVHTTHATAPVLTGMEDGGAAAHNGSQSATAASPQPSSNHGTPAGVNTAQLDPIDLPDEALTEQAARSQTHHHAHGHASAHSSSHAMEHASQKIAHQAAHSSEAHHDGASHEGGADSAEAPDSPDAPERRTRSAMRNTARTSQVWADRVGQRQASAVAPRSSQFSSELASERERLEQAMGQPQLG